MVHKLHRLLCSSIDKLLFQNGPVTLSFFPLEHVFVWQLTKFRLAYVGFGSLLQLFQRELLLLTMVLKRW